MKSLKEKEIEAFEGDLHAEHSFHKELKNKEKKSKRGRIDEDATVNTNSKRQEEGNKEGAAKVKKKKNDETKSSNDVASKEEKKSKEKKSKRGRIDEDSTTNTDSKRQEEVNKEEAVNVKKKNDETKSSNDMVSKEEKKNKEKKSKQGRIDEDATINTNSKRQEEGNKEEAVKVKKKKKNDEMKKCNDVASEEKVKKKEKKADEIMFDGDERIVEKRKKKKEKKGGISVGRENEKELESQKKGKRDCLVPSDDEKVKVEKKKKEKRDVVACSEGRQVVIEKQNEGDKEADNKEGEISKKKVKKRKRKETNADMIAGHEEKKVKDKKKKKDKGCDSKVDEMTTDIHPGNEAGVPEAKQAARKRRKLEKDDSEGKAGCETPKTKKKSSLADTSKNANPESKSKKVRFSDEVKVFPPPSTPATSNKHKDNLVRGKRFTKEEDELIKNAVMDYVEANRLGEDGVRMVLNCQPHKNLRGCWKVIGAALPWRPHVSVNYRAHILFEQGERVWTPEEIELVREGYKKYGSNWKMIADELGKSRIHVKDAYRRYKFGDLNHGRWSQEEYQTLFEGVNTDLKFKVLEAKKTKYGMLRDNIGWEAISEKLGTRINSECCLKWYKQLTSPMVASKEWADVDDYMLVMALSELDCSCEEEVEWDFLLEHRSGEVCLKRWRQMVRHLGEHGNKTFSEQVDVLSKRYCPNLAEVREAMDAREIVD